MIWTKYRQSLTAHLHLHLLDLLNLRLCPLHLRHLYLLHHLLNPLIHRLHFSNLNFHHHITHSLTHSLVAVPSSRESLEEDQPVRVSLRR